jgi:hypothetical protein
LYDSWGTHIVEENDTMTYVELAPVIDSAYAVALAVILFVIVRQRVSGKSDK